MDGYKFFEIPIFMSNYIDESEVERDNIRKMIGECPITGHYSNPLTWITINNIGCDESSTPVKDNKVKYCKYICLDSYDSCIRDLIIRKSAKVHVFGSMEDFEDSVKTTPMPISTFIENLYYFDTLRSFGEVYEIHHNKIKVRVDPDDRFCKLIERAECENKLFAFVRFEHSEQPICKLGRNEIPIYECTKIISYDIILPDNYYDDFMAAKNSVLRND